MDLSQGDLWGSLVTRDLGNVGLEWLLLDGLVWALLKPLLLEVQNQESPFQFDCLPAPALLIGQSKSDPGIVPPAPPLGTRLSTGVLTSYDTGGL